MNDEFTLSIEYKGEIHDYPARLLEQGFNVYKIIVTINDIDVYFERDEERNFRVVSMPDQDKKKLEKIDKSLLHLLANKIEELLL